MRIKRDLEISGDFKINLRKIPINATEKASIVRDHKVHSLLIFIT